MPPRIESIAGAHLREPVRIRMGRAQTEPGEAPLVRQSAYVVPRSYKPAALGRILDIEAPSAAIVFCRTRDEVDHLTETLNGRGYRAEALHGGMGQEARDRVMARLRAGTADLIVATDVAARGLDIEQLTHVVNYDVPSAPESYVHRIGRVGRAGREGVAITLAEPREHRMLKTIERVTRQRIDVLKVPTVADLRTRQLELTRAAVRETLLQDAEDGGLDRYRSVVETLTDEFDILEVALAAVKLVHESNGMTDDDAEIPEVQLRTGPRADRPAGPSTGRDSRAPGGRESYGGRGGGAPGGRGGAGNAGMTRLFIGLGRRAGIRPGDLVGAITGESRLGGRDVGAIEIADRFSLVEVPDAAAEDVIAALRTATFKGKKATVRRERF
jgi:ATP-dependent RNA helicase DeaD